MLENKVMTVEEGKTVMSARYRWWLAAGLILIASGICIPLDLQADQNLSTGQFVYVPVYSHIYSGNRENPIYLAATLSIRNVDPKSALTLLQVDYFDSDGRLIKRYLDNPIQLGAMASTRYIIKESDKAGGSGANFIVRWQADQAINAPLIESIMISTKSQSGISFTSRGRVIEDAKGN